MDVVGRPLSRLLLARSTAYFQGRLQLVSRRVTCIFEFAKLHAAASEGKVGKIVLFFSPSVWYCWWFFTKSGDHHRIDVSRVCKKCKKKTYQPQLVPSVCSMASNMILEHLQFKENPWKICRFTAMPPFTRLEGIDQVRSQVISLWVYLMKLYETTIVDGWNRLSPVEVGSLSYYLQGLYIPGG